MKNLLIFLSLAPSCFAMESATPSFVQDAIYLGQPSTSAGDAWKSVIEWRGDTGRCTGVFIENDVILTAAHCGPNLTKNADLLVYYYIGTELDNIVTHSSGDFVMIKNPGYRENTPGATNYDLAVIVTKKPVVEAPYKTLDFMTTEFNSLADPGHNVLMVGTGGTSMSKHTFNDGVRFTNAVIESYPDRYVVSARGNNGSGICYGDSGGPLLVRAGGSYRLLGILSGFYPQGNCDSGGLYAYLGSTNYNWIQSAISTARQRLE